MIPFDLMSGLKQDQIDILNKEINQDLVKKNQYDKFGDGTYLSVDVFRRIMNEVFGHAWSWEIVDIQEKSNPGSDKTDFVLAKGRLTVPGVGVKEGFGVGKFDKKDNSTAYSAAASFAFKNCCRMVGVGASILDDDFDRPLLEEEVSGAAPAKTPPVDKPIDKPADKPVKNDAPEQRDERPASNSKPKAGQWNDEQLKKAEYIKKTYKIANGAQMLAFAQIWNPKIKDRNDLTPEVFEKLYDYVEENSEEFERFDPSEVA